MAAITAADVKALRDLTGLPMMDCKKALQKADGDQEAAIKSLRESGKNVMEGRADRETSTGRIAVHVSLDPGIGAMVELLCESTPVANNDEFIALSNDLASRLATMSNTTSADELLEQPSPSKPDQTLRQQFDDLNNRIREVFRIGRLVRIDGPCGGYVHHDGVSGVLLEIEGGTSDLAKDICMHIVAMRPKALNKEDLDPDLVEKEREIQRQRARKEGKPEKIIEKMVEGRIRGFFAEQCLVEQEFVKDTSQRVGKVAEAANMKILQFVFWKLGQE